MAKPFKERPEALSEILRFRMTASMRTKIREEAEAANLSDSEIIRRRLDGRHTPSRETQNLANELRNLRQEVARQHGLIKHHHNQNPFDPERIKSSLKGGANDRNRAGLGASTGWHVSGNRKQRRYTLSLGGAITSMTRPQTRI